MTRVKICGITQFEDARDAALLGADAIGLNFYPNSPRYIEPSRAAKIIEHLPPFVTVVGIFLNHPDPQSLEDASTDAIFQRIVAEKSEVSGTASGRNPRQNRCTQTADAFAGQGVVVGGPEATP